jgi:tetratricopeptide (TPR) repeat protein
VKPDPRAGSDEGGGESGVRRPGAPGPKKAAITDTAAADPIRAASPHSVFAASQAAVVGGAVLPPPAPVRGDPAAVARQEAARGHALFARGQFQAAVDCLTRAVSLRPDEAAYHTALAAAAEGAGRDADVEAHAGEAARLDPDDALAHHLLAKWSYRKGLPEQAIDHAARAAALAPDDVGYAVHHGTLLFDAGRPREARGAIERPLAAGSTDRWLAHLYARLAPAVKEGEAALAVLERALRAPDLVNDPGGAPLLHFAACTLLDRMGRHDAAFEHAKRANEISRDAASASETARHGEWVSRKIRYFTRDRVDSLPRATHDSRRPLFILGMPRSGTTLVEQILGRHPAVHPGGELQGLRLLARDSADADWAAGESYPEYFDDLSVGRANRLADQYLSMLDALDAARPGGRAAYVTDKQPLNFLILHMVELLFPRGRVIHCVRGALDTCLSCYLTHFEQHNPFKFDLADLGAYYRDYLRLMEHWKKVLTVPILEVRYEDLVLDTRVQVRRMLDFLELPWDDRCLRYYESDRRVLTASLDQVRRPIYTASIGRWKHYEKHLGPLIQALGTAG